MARANTIPGAALRGKYTVWLLSILALVVFGVSGWAWWHYVRSNPVRVFNAMLENNLKTTGVTDRLVGSDGSQGLDQTIQLMTTPSHIAHAYTTVSRTGDGAASVTTETIGTHQADYVRYLSVDADQKEVADKVLNLANVKDVWGKTSPPEGSDPSEASGELYNQTILAVIPIGNVSVQARRELLQQIRDEGVYTVDYSHVERSIRNGRPEYTYQVAIKADAYVSVLKNFARQLGLTQLEQVDPANYAGGDPIKVTIGVDVWAQQLNRIAYEGDTRAEALSGFGGQFKVTLPKETIPLLELQKRSQTLQ